MTLFLALIGIFLSVILLYFNAKKYPSTIYLGLFFFLISIYCLIEYALFYSKSIVLTGLVYLNIGFLTYLVGPMLYLYFRSILTDNHRLKRNDFWHLIPMLIFFFTTLPYTFTSWSYKVELATKIVEDPNYIWKLEPTILYKYVPSVFIFLSRPVFVLFYVGWGTLKIIGYYKKKDKFTFLSKQHFMKQWLFVLVSFLLLLIIGHLIEIFEVGIKQNLNLFFSLNILQTISGIGLVGILASPFFFPGILYGLPKIPTIEKEHSKAKKQIPDFETNYLNSISEKVENYMEKFRPYLNPECNLALFAKKVNIPAHHLAYYFREIRKENFNDFKNDWRIKHAKNLIEEGKAKEIKLEALGKMSGFSSRSAFFTAFKKREGISPGTFASRNSR